MNFIRRELNVLSQALSRQSWRELAIYFALYVLPILLFVSLADDVLENETLWFDEAILRSIHSLATPWLDTVVRAATDLGYVWWVGFLAIITFALCIRANKYRDALIVLVGVGGSAVINLLLKALFQRDRPQLWERIVTENSHSFPSGHAMASASIAIVLIVILWPTKWRWWALSGGLLYMIIIALTRLYLGVHYPTDIVAGWVMTFLWVMIAAAVIKNWKFKKT